jgi:hypothetical protein
MFDQMLFPLSCGHDVVLGRLQARNKWTCETCGMETDLSAEPAKARLVQEIDTALQIDLQAQERGESVTRLG